MNEFSTAESWTEKYRPKSLDEVVGQAPVVNMIKGMIAQKQVPSTMLISGKTGLGKSSLAFIIAYAINELPYGTVTSDIHDHNVGADGGKEEILQILKLSAYKPTANFRVIILDEIHRASAAAASALLKPLEKPSPNTVFILATDQPEKLLQPIIGRSVQLALESLEPNDLIPRLKTIVKKEKLTFMTDAVLLKIAQNSNAQPRAAINLLQATASAYYGSKDLKVALNSAISALGANVDLLAAKLLACVYTHKQKAIINTLKLVKTGEYISIASYLLYTNSYLIESKVGINTWTNEARNKLNAAIADNKPSLQKMLMVHSELVEIKKALATFLVPEADVLMCNLLKLSIGD